MKVYLDSCILIYRVEGTEDFSRSVADAVRSAPDSEFCISDLVRLECLVHPIRHKDAPLRQLYEAQFQLLTCLPLDAEAYDLAAELRAETRLKVPDALHAAGAIRNRCNELWTNDGRFQELGDRLAVRVIA